jgi:hypothetical protein
MTDVNVGGTIMRFPDGMSQDEMAAAIQKHFGAPTEEAPRDMSLLAQAGRAIDYPGMQKDIAQEGLSQMGQGLSTLGEPTGGDIMGSVSATLRGLGNIAGGAIQYAGSPLWAGTRMAVGRPLEAVGIPKEYSEFAANLAIPLPKAPKSILADTKGAGPIAQEQAFQAADRGYKAAREADFAVAPDMTEMVQGQLKDSLRKQGFRESNPAHAPVFNALDELPTGKYADVSDFDSVRQAIQNSGAPQGAVRNAIRGIDDFLSPKVPEIAEARGNYAAASRSEDFGQAMERAERGAGNTAVQTQARALRNNEEAMRGWSQAEKDQLDKIIKGGGVERTTRTVSTALGGGGGPLSTLLAFKTGGLSLIGVGLRALANTTTSANVAKLEQMLLSRAPESQRLVGPMGDFSKVAQAATASPNASNLSRLMLASRNLSNNLKDVNIHIDPSDMIKSLFGKPAAAGDSE